MRLALPVFLMLSAACPAFALDKATPESILAASKAAFSDACWLLAEQDDESSAPTELPVAYDVTVPSEYGDAPETYVIWEVLCDRAAYNELFIYWVEDKYFGATPLSFPVPVYKAQKERPDDTESPVKSIALTGWTSMMKLVNPVFDPATRSFSHYSKYRGFGDAFDAGTWVFNGNGTELVFFEVDASYDGEINPLPLFPEP